VTMPLVRHLGPARFVFDTNAIRVPLPFGILPAGRFQVRAASSDDARVDAARLAHRAAGDRVIPPYRALVAQTAAAAHRPTLAASEQALEAIRRTTRG
jgi:hypothetical protein